MKLFTVGGLPLLSVSTAAVADETSCPDGQVYSEGNIDVCREGLQLMRKTVIFLLVPMLKGSVASACLCEVNCPTREEYSD